MPTLPIKPSGGVIHLFFGAYPLSLAVITIRILRHWRCLEPSAKNCTCLCRTGSLVRTEKTELEIISALESAPYC